MLEGEVAIEKDSSSIDISGDNYDFHFVREDNVNDQRCYVLEMVPKRKDKNLLRGNVWVDANTYLPHRVEGDFARNPSWWVKNVNIVLLFGDADGMWLQTALEATGNVRILGQATVVSQDVNYETGEAVADKSSAQHNAVFSVLSARRLCTSEQTRNLASPTVACGRFALDSEERSPACEGSPMKCGFIPSN
jgi:hypothetical protein